jgi:hypothetical protein
MCFLTLTITTEELVASSSEMLTEHTEPNHNKQTQGFMQGYFQQDSGGL